MYADDTSVPVNMLSVHLPVQFCITNIYQYAYSCAEPQRLLKDAAQACLTREAVSHALFDLISSGQQMLTDELHARMQDTVNRYQLGIKIVFVGLQGIHPPVATADAFESVIGALEEKEAIIHAAKGSSQRTRSISRAEATSVVFNAQAYTAQRTALAAAEAFRFEQRLTAYSLSPRVLKKELYLRTLQQALNNTRKFIISAEADNEVLIFDFEKKRHPDLFDFTPSATRMMD
jgi:membrane protease subunit HflK